MEMNSELLSKFDRIRPYTDHEAEMACKRIAEDPILESIRAAVLPGMPLEALKAKLYSLDNVYDFQAEVMADTLRSILVKTTESITYEGVDRIKGQSKHLIISNHRDIFLDPAIMQLIFFDNSVPPTEVAVGDNLITNSFIEDIARSNRMIKVIRSGSAREKYSSSVILSEYIRSRVATQECSVWIAQRNGRTKNGMDATEQGLLKMFDMSGSGDFIKDFSELSIIPLSISYEFEPCDFLKTRELYISRRTKYVKAPGEDLNSILTGIKQTKGRVHYHFAEEISVEDIEKCARFDKNERYQALCRTIDGRINKYYRLWPNNYIAYDILNRTNKFSDKYSPEQREYFKVYAEHGLSLLIAQDKTMDINELRDIFLSIYAGPVINRHI